MLVEYVNGLVLSFVLSEVILSDSGTLKQRILKFRFVLICLAVFNVVLTEFVLNALRWETLDPLFSAVTSFYDVISRASHSLGHALLLTILIWSLGFSLLYGSVLRYGWKVSSKHLFGIGVLSALLLFLWFEWFEIGKGKTCIHYPSFFLSKNQSIRVCFRNYEGYCDYVWLSCFVLYRHDQIKPHSSQSALFSGGDFKSCFFTSFCASFVVRAHLMCVFYHYYRL